MMLRFFTLWVMSCSFWSMQAQDTPFRHWNFDGSESEYLGAMTSVIKPNISDGIKEFGVYLDGKNHYFTPRGLDLTDDFSVSFWIKPTNAEKPQTIFIQEKIANKTTQTERFLHFFMQGKKLFLKDEKNYLSLKAMPIEDGEWYLVSYSYDGFEAKILWQGEKVYSTGKVTLYNKLAQRSDILSIGKEFGTYSKLEGVLDEVKIFNRAIKDNQVLNDFQNNVPIPVAAVPVPKIDTPKVEIPKEIKPIKPEKPVEKIVDDYAKDYLNGRKNEVQHTIKVTATNIEVEVWDYDEFDKDRISITLNNSAFIGNDNRNRIVQKKRRREVYKFNLETEKINYLTFIAEDMGLYESQNTAAVRLTVNGKKFNDIYKLVLTKKQNAVLKIVHVPLNPNKKPIVPDAVPADNSNQDIYKVVVDNDVLDPLVVNSTDISIKILGNQDGNKKIQIQKENQLMSPPFTVNRNRSKTINFNISTQKEEILLIEAIELKKGDKCKVRVQIGNNGRVIKTYNLQLDKKNTLLPLVYVPDADARKPKNKKLVVVTDTLLTIQVKDNSKIDGDIITIKQGNKVVLSNYLLTGVLKDVPVTLKSNQRNTFYFVPVSMGTSNGENTAYVSILAANGQVIHEFSLSSQDINKPAQLTIIHKNN